jgi:cation:H+ antiporter
MMLLPVLYLLGGLILLLISADWLTKGAAQIADQLGVSHIFIGLTVVAFGTSAPEIFVTVKGAITGSDNISLGNVMGSNVTNIGLILGFTAVLAPIAINNSIYRKEILPFLFSQGLFFILLMDLNLSFTDGLMMLLALAGILFIYVRRARQGEEEVLDSEEVEEMLKGEKSWAVNLLLILVGLGGLALASEILIHNAMLLALRAGISEFTIAATVIALGTSFPELATCYSASRQGHSELVLGNVIGSNLWNILAALGLSSLFQPVTASRSVYLHDGGIMAGFTLLFVLYLGLRRRIGRISGIIFLAAYVSYVVLLYLR